MGGKSGLNREDKNKSFSYLRMYIADSLLTVLRRCTCTSLAIHHGKLKAGIRPDIYGSKIYSTCYLRAPLITELSTLSFLPQYHLYWGRRREEEEEEG